MHFQYNTAERESTTLPSTANLTFTALLPAQRPLRQDSQLRLSH